MQDYWKDKATLVTGGSAGLGLAIATALATAGAHVALCGRRPKGLSDAAQRLQTAAPGCQTLEVVANMTVDADVERLVAETVARFGRLDLLVNNVGRSARGLAIDVSPAQYAEELDLNFLTVVRGSRSAAPHLLKTGGHLVNIGSLAAKTASRFMGPYAVTKFAVAAYSQQLRLELGPQGLHVLLVCPGPIDREDAGRRYPWPESSTSHAPSDSAGLPASASAPAAGAKVKALRPERVAAAILRACQRRDPELVLPGKARVLFALQQLSPRLGDWLLRKLT
jgi:NAD(P)-dependent dehydrogenase (short-subunit alcohol dehydrogenase family)